MGDKAQTETAEHEENRIRNGKPLGDDHECHHHHEQERDDLCLVHFARRLSGQSRIRRSGRSFRVRSCAIRFQFGKMFLRPAANRLQWLDQSAAQFGKRVFNLGWNLRINFALYEPIPLEAAQSLREHFLRNTADLALEFGVTSRSAGQNLDDECSPFVGDPIKDKTRRTPRIQNIVLFHGWAAG